MIRHACAGLLALSLAACGGAPRAGQNAVGADTAVRRAEQAQQWHRAAESITADLLVRVKPAGRDALTFTVNVWSPADGSVRLQVSKVGVSGFDALIQPDGSFTVVSREDDVVVDDLEHAFADELGQGAALARLVEELKIGPVPAAATFTADGGTLSATDPATGLPVTLLFAEQPEQIASKSWTGPDGKPGMRLEYSRYKIFDGMQRPSVIAIRLPGRDGEFLVRVQDLNAVPSISDGRMRVAVPNGRPQMGFDEFLTRLAE